jgi:ComF family protein
MTNFIKQLLDWIFHKKCYICGKNTNSESVCKSCLNKIETNNTMPHQKFGSFEIYSAGMYTANMRKLVRGLKYHKKKDLAKNLAFIMYQYWKTLNVSSNKYEIVPMPMFPQKEKERGYNQTNLLALEFAKLTGYNVNYKIAKKILNTEPFYKLSKRERADSLREAFTVNKKEYNGKKILLLDDISTTGITLTELKKAFEREEIQVDLAIVAANPINENLF